MKNAGHCYRAGSSLVVVVDAKQCWRCALDTVIHEWAHAMTWLGDDAARDEYHGPEWGAAYARIVALFADWDYGATH